ESYSQALAMAREAGNVDEQLNDLNGLGLLHGGLADFQAADDYYREAFRLNHETLRQDSPMLLNNHAHILVEAGRIGEARQEATHSLALARAGHQVESEADALAELAQVDRIGGDPRHAVELDRQALAVAKQSGKKVAIVEVGFDLALALEDTGSAAAARETLRTADSLRGSDEGFASVLTSALLSFNAGNYAETERMARAAIEDARKDGSPHYELRAETLLARALLAEGHNEEARAAARQAVTIPQTPDISLSRIEARFADAAACGGELDGLAGMAERSGYVQLALEIRLAAAAQAVRHGRSGARRLLHDVMREAASKGYTALAARAQSVN
ncbi:MAG TPA: tetratricopeptide repeat protein, partial [Candidatus Sulfopaludibacter sp.]|nr:tetratricopeptide repeat protein [Candidatus Sulfopaludibacter sp.]